MKVKSIYSGSAPADDVARLERLTLGVKELLDICEENHVEVPEELRNSLIQTLEEHRCASHTEYLAEKTKESRESIAEVDLATEVNDLFKRLKATMPPINLRVKGGSYTVTNYVSEDIRPFHKESESESDGPRRAKQKIQTVQTESPFYKLAQCILKCFMNNGNVRGVKQERKIMEGVDLALENGKMYLVLGAPGCGKSTLLKMIANNLHKSPNHKPGGEVSICGITPGIGTVWTNLAGYIDQIDRLHPFLTVFETCEFAWNCRSGGTHRLPNYGEGPEVDELVKEMDETLAMPNKILTGLGLARVKDTFVGDQSRVRGVSGGEKKRVTVAEMHMTRVPVLCCDEISTGLDAATTFDITRLMGAVNKITNGLKIVSLLQPPPETVAIFDELIVLSEGKVIYCGPLEDVIPHFNALGYHIPERVDVADWLQALPTREGANYLKEASDLDKETLASKHLSTEEFHQKFYESDLGKSIRERLEAPQEEPSELIKSISTGRYKNSWYKSLKLLVQRELTLWWRDKYQIRAKVGQSVILGTIVGTLFFQSSDTPSNVVAILFQSLLSTTIGAMTAVVKQFPDRSTFYKQQDANFFPTWTFVAGRSIAAVPNALIDAVFYGTMIYFLVGLAVDEGASIVNYFVFMLLLFVSSLTAGLFFGIFSSAVQTLSTAQACMSIAAVMFIIFSGFTVQPDVIPDYYIWLYYINFIAWGLRGLMVNEFDSGKYDFIPPNSTLTQGEQILTRFGFTDGNDEPYTSEWKWWAILFTLASAALAVLASTWFLNNIRFATGQSLVTDQGDDEIEELAEEDTVSLPFKKVDLAFKDVHYTVQSSISDDKIELLKGIDGVVESGKLTALMGSSGAGKTTLMDVLALRKTSGELVGEITLNGHPQEEVSFRRCSGYVEQFVVETPQLTIRETVEFSANLRLDEKDQAVTADSKKKFVNQTLNMLELSNIQDLQVGSDAEGGLSFEQRKRLSIAVELVANPSILFLDEPTSGLDARAAAIVMRGMKRIADGGRAVCATIHQPSVAIFNDFDSLLLLKRGGEVVFFGDLGEDSSNLIEYLERYDATPRINPGENPATWMLTSIGAGSATSKKAFDYAGYYAQSRLRAHCLDKIEKLNAGKSPEGKVEFASKFAASYSTQSTAVLYRTMKVYFRSPSYNVTRVLVSAIVALIFGSVYASQRVPENESDLNSRINSVYMAIIFLCVNAMNSVLAVFEFERNMFYRHRAAGMYQPSAIARALTLAEIPFIFVTSTVFVVMFYFILGFSTDPDKFFLFYLLTTLAFASFTYIGQMFVALLRDAETAQVLGGLFISQTAMFAGILIRPSDIPAFWLFMYWITPGHYIFEGIFMSQYNGDNTVIEASPGSPFFMSLEDCRNGPPCSGTAEQWVDANFTDWSVDNIRWSILYLFVLVVLTRVVTLYALSRLDYRAN